MRAHDSSGPPDPRWPFRSALAWLLLLAGCLFALAQVEFEFLKQTADSFSGSGNAEVITPEFHVGLVRRLRIFAVLLAFLALPLLLLREVINRLPAEWRRSNRRLLADARWYVQEAKGERRIVRVAALVLIALGIALRLEFLDQPLRFDEGRTFLSFVQMPFAYIPLRYNQPNNHILNTLLVKLSTGLCGDAEWAIRLPTFVCGCLVLPVTFLALRRLHGTGAALVGLALVATSSPLIEFSTNARGYMLVMLAFLGMIVFGSHAVRERSLASWGWTVIFGVLGALCIPIMLLPAASVFLWLALYIWMEHEGEARARRLRDMLIAGLTMAAITLLLYTPAMAINAPSALTSNEGVNPGSIATLLAGTPAFLSALGGTWHRDYPPVLSVILLAGAVLALLAYRRIATIRAPLHLCVAAVVLLYLLVISDFGWLRVWLFLVPVYLGLAGAGLHALVVRALRPAGSNASAWGAIVLALSLATVSGWQVLDRGSILRSPETGVFPAAETAIVALESQLQPGDLLAVYATNVTQIEYYARRHGVVLRPLGDFENARWFRIGGEATGDNSAWFVINRLEGYRDVGVDYLSERRPPGTAWLDAPEVFLRTDAVELHRARAGDRPRTANGKVFPADGGPR